MKKKLVVPKLPTDPTDEQKEAFRASVTESIENFSHLTPEERNRFLSSVLLQLAGVVPSTLPEGVTTEPIHPRFINRLERLLKRKIRVGVSK